tara:strand:- start:44 stop:211 length:168 start_codon:yes stop_codon:yes gene_type:complete
MKKGKWVKLFKREGKRLGIKQRTLPVWAEQCWLESIGADVDGACAARSLFYWMSK